MFKEKINIETYKCAHFWEYLVTFIGVVAFYLNVDVNCTYFIYWKHTLVFSWSSTKSFNLQFGISSKFSFVDLKEEELTLRWQEPWWRCQGRSRRRQFRWQRLSSSQSRWTHWRWRGGRWGRTRARWGPPPSGRGRRWRWPLWTAPSRPRQGLCPLSWQVYSRSGWRSS